MPRFRIVDPDQHIVHELDVETSTFGNLCVVAIGKAERADTRPLILLPGIEDHATVASAHTAHHNTRFHSTLPVVVVQNF